eukprot:8056031-Lingulodinium_polyedra.AAC.1
MAIWLPGKQWFNKRPWPGRRLNNARCNTRWYDSSPKTIASLSPSSLADYRAFCSTCAINSW